MKETSPMADDNCNLENAMQGTWWLISREDYSKDGVKRIDPVLGADPIAILVYANNHFAAQFMKRDRNLDSFAQVTNAGKNNTAALGGYDAYFGTYQIDEKTKQVYHTLVGSINPVNIGMTVQRTLEVENNKLTIRLDTTSSEGEPIIRTLIWKRIK